MSNLLYMDESNGNGVYATKHNHLHNNVTVPTITTTNTSNSNTNNTNNINNTPTVNNINNIVTTGLVNVNSVSAGGGGGVVGNNGATAVTMSTLPISVSNEDLSQSLSEYTDADESISAPTEFLAEFLSAVMLKDYKKALKYCKLILQYEPNNATAKEFYPLILDKLRGTTSSDSDENYNKSSSPELILELQSSDPSAGESDEVGSDDQPVGACIEDGDEVDGYGAPEDNSSGEPNSNLSSEPNISHSLSESMDGDNDVDEDVDDIDDDDDEIDCDVDVEDDDDDEEEEEDEAISSSGEDLPIDDPNLLGEGSLADDGGGGLCGNGSNSPRNSSSGGEGRSRSDNTTHSYSSLLLEEEDDIVPAHLQFTKELTQPDLDVSNGNKVPSASCSDSESPTEPLTQRLAAILLSKCGVSTNNSNH